jgi:hypothetical protein
MSERTGDLKMSLWRRRGRDRHENRRTSFWKRRRGGHMDSNRFSSGKNKRKKCFVEKKLTIIGDGLYMC